jgi:malate dehydrogenase (quinone)
MHSRPADQPVAATRVDYGSDVDFGSLTRHMIKTLQAHKQFDLHLGQAVKDLKRDVNGRWQVSLQERKSRKRQTIHADFVFLGAGGGALPLLQKSGIPEAKGYGGFPVSGQWLVCHNPDIVNQHGSKVYGKAPVGAPPMSVPHLDTRIIDGQPALLFGPYAGFTTKFLKQGSLLDLAASVKTGNLKPMLKAGMHNMDLTRYLVSEVFQSHKTRIQSLRDFYPVARSKDWKLAKAGQRVQIIKHCENKGGKLEFGTEIVAAKDGSLAALLGASPGASTSVQAMIEVLQRCFPDRMKNEVWLSRMREMVPSYGKSLVQDAALANEVRQRTLATLKLV